MKGNHRVHEPIIPCTPPTYRCHRAEGGVDCVDGDLSKPFWQQGEWIEDFHDIEGDSRPRPYKRTSVKLLWNDEALYIGAKIEDDTIWATVFDRDRIIYVDNDFEVFLAPQDSSHRYYELEINAANAVWDLFMERPQRDRVRRIIGWDIHGLKTAVKVDGELNNPSAANRGWTVEMKLPWFSFRECGLDQCYPERFTPIPGEIWRLDFSRVEYEVEIRNGRYEKVRGADGNPLPEHNWLWAPTGVIDAHMPEMWGYLVFTESGEAYPLPEADAAKCALRRLYYREHEFCCLYGRFCDDAASLLREDANRWGVKVFTTPSMFEGILVFKDEIWHIDQDGYIWKGEER